MFSTVFGVGVFLTLLLFASHLLINLWLTSSIEAVAHDAATDVAVSGAAEQPAVRARAVSRARQALGAYGDRVDFVFEPSAPTEVRLRVTAPFVRLLPPLVADVFSPDGLNSLQVVTVEQP